MRIISGEMKGFKLKSPKGTDTRPTSDRVKESLFNIIGYIDSDSKVLDLFSGSGNIGLEFLSRGAKIAYFIDNSSVAISTVKDNIEKCKVEKKTKIFKNDVFKALEILDKRKEKFDYIFLDPPYEQGLIKDVLEQISSLDILKEDALVIVEYESNLNLENFGNLNLVDTRKYGTTKISFYRK